MVGASKKKSWVGGSGNKNTMSMRKTNNRKVENSLLALVDTTEDKGVPERIHL